MNQPISFLILDNCLDPIQVYEFTEAIKYNSFLEYYQKLSVMILSRNLCIDLIPDSMNTIVISQYPVDLSSFPNQAIH